MQVIALKHIISLNVKNTIFMPCTVVNRKMDSSTGMEPTCIADGKIKGDDAIFIKV